MSENLNVLIINGTSRKNNQSSKVSKYLDKNFLNLTQNINAVRDSYVLKVSLVAPENFNLPFLADDTTQKDPKYTKLIEEADAIIIVVPEYNHSFPGSLKHLLDSEFSAYFRKAVGLVGVSAGAFGGTRAIEALIPVLRALGLYVCSKEVLVHNVYDLFGEDGDILLKKEQYDHRFKQLLEELLWLASALKIKRN